MFLLHKILFTHSKSIEQQRRSSTPREIISTFRSSSSSTSPSTIGPVTTRKALESHIGPCRGLEWKLLHCWLAAVQVKPYRPVIPRASWTSATEESPRCRRNWVRYDGNSNHLSSWFIRSLSSVWYPSLGHKNTLRAAACQKPHTNQSEWKRLSSSAKQQKSHFYSMAREENH